MEDYHVQGNPRTGSWTHTAYGDTHASGYSQNHRDPHCGPGHMTRISRHTHTMPCRLYKRRGARPRARTHIQVWGRLQSPAPLDGKGGRVGRPWPPHRRARPPPRQPSRCPTGQRWPSRRGCRGGGGSQFPTGTGSPQAQGDRLTFRPHPLSAPPPSSFPKWLASLRGP